MAFAVQISQGTLIQLACRSTRTFRRLAGPSTESSEVDDIREPGRDRMMRRVKYPHNESNLHTELERYHRAHGGFPAELGVRGVKSISYRNFEWHFAAEDHWKPIDCEVWLKDYWWTERLLQKEFKVLHEKWQKKQQELEEDNRRLKKELGRQVENYNELERRFRRLERFTKDEIRNLKRSPGRG